MTKSLTSHPSVEGGKKPRPRFLGKDRPVEYLRDACPVGYYTRYDLLERTGRSEKEIKRAEARGVLRADARNSHGWSLYSQETLDKLVEYFKRLRPKIAQIVGVDASYSDDQGLKGFALLKAGKTPADVAEELQCHPSIASSIANDYSRMQGAVLLPGEMVRLIEALPIDGERPLTTPEGVLEIIKQAMRRSACGKCGSREAALCKACTQNHVDRAIEKERAKAFPLAEDSSVEMTDPEALLAAAKEAG